MLIGVPKEIKNNEYRVGLTPAVGSRTGPPRPRVLVQAGAGLEIGLDRRASTPPPARQIVPDAADVFGRRRHDREGQGAAAGRVHAAARGPDPLHLPASGARSGADRGLLMESGARRHRLRDRHGRRRRLPLLTPMSEVAGRMAVQVGAHCLEKAQGGRGILLGGVPGVARRQGGDHRRRRRRHQRRADGDGAWARRSPSSTDQRARAAEARSSQFGASIQTSFPRVDAIEEHVLDADLVIGAVLVPGAAAPKLVTRDMVARDEAGRGGGRRRDRPGRLLRDLARDHPRRPDLRGRWRRPLLRGQHAGRGGRAPSTFALNNATLPFTLALADKGWRQALADDEHLLHGLNVCRGALTYRAVAEAQELPWTPASQALQA